MNKDRMLQYLTDLNKYLGYLSYELDLEGIDLRNDINNIHWALNQRILPKLNEYFKKRENEK